MDDSKTGTEQLKQGKFYDLNTSPASTVLKTADLLVSLGIKRTTLYDWIHKKYLPPLSRNVARRITGQLAQFENGELQEH